MTTQDVQIQKSPVKLWNQASFVSSLQLWSSQDSAIQQWMYNCTWRDTLLPFARTVCHGFVIFLWSLSLILLDLTKHCVYVWSVCMSWNLQLVWNSSRCLSLIFKLCSLARAGYFHFLTMRCIFSLIELHDSVVQRQDTGENVYHLRALRDTLKYIDIVWWEGSKDSELCPTVWSDPFRLWRRRKNYHSLGSPLTVNKRALHSFTRFCSSDFEPQNAGILIWRGHGFLVYTFSRFRWSTMFQTTTRLNLFLKSFRCFTPIYPRVAHSLALFRAKSAKSS